MAFNQLGTESFKKGITTVPTIVGVTIFSAVNVTEGYRTITEIVGHDGETATVVMAGAETLDISVTGYLNSEGTPPKNGDTATLDGWTIVWIDGVTIAETPEGVQTVSATVHARKKVVTPAT